MKISWRQYSALIKAGWQSVLSYRVEAFLWATVDFFPLLAQFFVWQAVFNLKNQVRGMGFKEVITYYFLLTFVKGITRTYFEGRMINMIKRGSIAALLIKPLNIFSYFVVQEISWKLVRQVFTFLLAIIAFFLIGNKISVLNITPLSCALFAGFILIGFWVSSLLSFLLGIVAFWIEEARGLVHARWILVGFLSGSFFPLAFLPTKIQRLAYTLPFRFMSFTPVSVLLGEKINWVGELTKGVIWIVILAFLASFFWRKGVKKFIAVGN